MCPYKGTARYWSVRAGDAVHADLAWSYDAPFRESAPIAGLVAFYDEKVDVYVDGALNPGRGRTFPEPEEAWEYRRTGARTSPRRRSTP